jgi:RNA recognition motif-containing protein
MSFTVFLGNLPVWVTADDIRGWLSAENLVADAIKVIRNPETQESKGFAFIESPNAEEMHSIIRRFDRAPLEDRLLRANPAQPPKSKGPMPPPGSVRPGGAGPAGGGYGVPRAGQSSQGLPSSQSHASQRHVPQGHASSQSHASQGLPPASQAPQSSPQAGAVDRPPRRGKNAPNGGKRSGDRGPQSAFAEELAKAL